MRIKLIISIGIVSTISMAFKMQTDSTNQLLLTGGSAKVWNLTHSLVNDYETTVKSIACQSKKIRLKFSIQNNVSQDTTCLGNGNFVDPIPYVLTNDSISFADLSYKLENITDTKMVLTKTKPTVLYDEQNQRLDTVVAVYKLLFEVE